MLLSFLLRSVSYILTLRYRITFVGLEAFDSQGPVIVFPNHPALIDPMILLSHISKKRILSPVMTESYFHTPGLGGIIKALKTVPVGDIAAGGTIEDVKKAFSGIKRAMQEKQDILIYPSGHIYVQPFEHIVGKKMAYEIVKMLEGDTRIIVVRTKGLWGSIWGKSYTGDSPKLISVILQSITVIIVNFIFFVPRRDVSVECVDMTDTLKDWYNEGLDLFNQKLQDYYNEGGNEVCRFIPHYFYHNNVVNKTEAQNISGSIAELSIGSSFSEGDIPSEIFETVRTKVAEIKKINPKELRFNTNLILDLHADSLDMAEMKSAIQSLFPKASNPPIGLIKTLGDLSALALGILEGEENLQPVAFAQADKNKRVHINYTEGNTILSMLKKNFKLYRQDPFIYDAMTGMITRDEFLLRSYVIGEYIKKYHSNKIGIMLPALSASSLLLVGVYLAGKVPVMLNWTVGEKSFAHCMDAARLDTILTSRKFYTKITSPWLLEFEPKMIFIEDIIRDIPLAIKIKASIRKIFFLLPKSSSEAVILFTSGSESLPKAIVLSHENILSDIAGAIELVPFHKNEILLGFLPPFHSFGFTINTIFPLIAPVQVAYTPDPSDARTIGTILEHTRSTIVSATPTFLRMILMSNESNLLESLRYVFVGAEKCSEDVFTTFRAKCPEAKILEGYGITECSPIVTVNPLDQQKSGSAGKFLPHIRSSIRSIDGNIPVSTGEQGMIFVSGASIFSGYSDMALASPFEVFDGIKWYKTGDLGYIDEDEFLFITGRLKRFVKIAGEMISLPAIESTLLEKYGNPDITTLAVEAREIDGDVTLVVFATFDVAVEELNEYIHTHGLSNLVKIARVDRVDLIPVLGTGKTDYKILKSKI